MTRQSALRLLAVLALVAVALPGRLDAATATTDVTVNITELESLTLTRDDNSVSDRGSATNIVFNVTDDVDMGPPTGNAGFMYAPYRSETGQNWHLASIASNSPGFTLEGEVTVDQTLGDQSLSELLDVFAGGFFDSNGNSKGGASGDWELLQNFSRDLDEPFTGIMPFNYRLRIATVPAGDYEDGVVTYTLTPNP